VALGAWPGAAKLLGRLSFHAASCAASSEMNFSKCSLL
jgi:hypothetical protein